jgi:Cu/Ag efflux pump CusA
MIRALVDFALNNKFVVLAIAVLLLGWGAISFHDLPVEAYPDIGDNYVTVITQWAGRSAEEVEQQVTIPIEIQMAGMPHMTFLRSESIFGLSFVIMIFDVRRCWKDSPRSIFLAARTSSLRSVRTGASRVRSTGTRSEAQILAMT